MKNRIRQIRESIVMENGRHMTQAQLAALCGTTPQNIQYLESGRNALTQDWMNRISKALKIEPWYLITDPKTIVSEFDRELISRYHAADPRSKIAVDALLGIER